MIEPGRVACKETKPLMPAHQGLSSRRASAAVTESATESEAMRSQPRPLARPVELRDFLAEGRERLGDELPPRGEGGQPAHGKITVRASAHM